MMKVIVNSNPIDHGGFAVPQKKSLPVFQDAQPTITNNASSVLNVSQPNPTSSSVTSVTAVVSAPAAVIDSSMSSVSSSTTSPTDVEIDVTPLNLKCHLKNQRWSPSAH